MNVINFFTRSLAIAKKVDYTVYDIQYSCRAEPMTYNCTIISSWHSGCSSAVMLRWR